MKKISNELVNVLERCDIKGNNLFIPEQLDRTMYAQLKKLCLNMNGVWNRKVGGIVFDRDPNDYIESIILTGSYTDVKKLYQFFPTPEKVVDIMIKFAEFKNTDIIFEPSAGSLNIVNKVKPLVNNIYVSELNPEHYEKYPKDLVMLSTDFLQVRKSQVIARQINKIIANPPFNKLQDIDHVNHMIDLLEGVKDAKIITIMSPGYQYREVEKAKSFRNRLDNLQASGSKIQEIDLPEKSFSESGTNIKTVLLIIDL